MSDARDKILDAVRLGRATTLTTLSPSATLNPGRQALLPPRFVRDAPDLVELFLGKLDGVSASHAVVPRREDIPAHLADWLAGHGLAADFAIAPDPRLTSLDWASAKLRPQSRAPDPLAPTTVVSGAFAGVAETGSVAMSTSETSRPSHNLLAECHVVVLDRAQILPTMEDVWRAARQGRLPRSLAFITGPSRTADIEMSLELGVHGAVRMHVIVTG